MQTFPKSEYSRGLVALFIAGALLSHSPISPAEEDGWRFTLNFPMAWLPDIEGKIITNGDRTDIRIPFSDILDNLDAGFIGELYAEKGRWSLGWRSMLLAAETSSRTEPVTGLPGRPPIVGAHRIKVENDLFTSDLVAAYEVADYLDIYTGIRRTGNKTRVRVTALEEGLVELNGRYTVIDEELFDWVAGINLKHRFNTRWSAELQMDLAVDGDNDDNRLLNGFFEYRMKNQHSLWLGYRYLMIRDSVSEAGDRVKTEFTQKGPTLGWAWRF